MTLQQMSYILEVDRCGSMNKAAQSLFVSQSTLSGAIGEVERELGVTLFHRSNRGITLSEEGRDLVAQIAPIVERSRQLERYYARRRDGEWAQLSVAAQRYPFCTRAFVELLQSLGERPMQLRFKELDMPAVIAEVAGGESELGVIFVSDLTERTILRTLGEKNLVFTPLRRLRPRVFMRRGHPLAGEAALTLEQLRDYPHVVFTQSESDFHFAEEAVPGSGADFERMILVSDRATIYSVMAHTDAVSTGSGILPAGYSDERLLSIPLAGGRDMRLGLIHAEGRELSPLARRFVAILRGIVEEIGE